MIEDEVEWVLRKDSGNLEETLRNFDSNNFSWCKKKPLEVDENSDRRSKESSGDFCKYWRGL
jgi:hypothetical protein